MLRLTVGSIKEITRLAFFVVANGGNKGEAWESLGCVSPMGSLHMEVRPKRKQVDIQIVSWEEKVQFRSTPFGVKAEDDREPEGILSIRFYPDEQMEYGLLSREDAPKVTELAPHDDLLTVVSQLKVIFAPLMTRGLKRGRNGYIKVFQPR